MWSVILGLLCRMGLVRLWFVLTLLFLMRLPILVLVRLGLTLLEVLVWPVLTPIVSAVQPQPVLHAQTTTTLQELLASPAWTTARFASAPLHAQNVTKTTLLMQVEPVYPSEKELTQPSMPMVCS